MVQVLQRVSFKWRTFFGRYKVPGIAKYPISVLRDKWLDFTKVNGIPVPHCNLVMITLSSVVYSFLLDHVVRFQQRLIVSESVTIGADDDGVYYWFGGAALCSMLHALCKQITLSLKKSPYCKL